MVLNTGIILSGNTACTTSKGRAAICARRMYLLLPVTHTMATGSTVFDSGAATSAHQESNNTLVRHMYPYI